MSAGTNQTTLVSEIGRFAAGVDYDSLPPEVIDNVKARVMDTLGICLAALPLPEADAVRRMATDVGGRAEASAVGVKERLPVGGAAFVNGSLAHSLDFDDTHLPSILHPSATVVPTVLAVAESHAVEGRELIAAAAVGYEVTVRTGMAAYDRELGNSIFFERGFHATSICGTLGAAVAAAKLLGLEEAQIGHALGIAVSLGSGVIEANRAGGSVKRMHCGWAAQSGISAAQAARYGFTGPPTALEGRFGFYEAFCGGVFEESAIREALGERWSVPDIFFKPYPANHFTHAGIDAALRLRDRVMLDEIERIELGVAEPTLRTIAEPSDLKAHPATGYGAQFSGPFTVATALVGGGGLGVHLDDFTDDLVRDPVRLALAEKVRCVADPEATAVFPNEFPAVLRIQTRDGKVLEERVRRNRGGPGNPLTVAEIRRKFLLNAGRVLDEPAAARIAYALGELESTKDMEAILGPVRHASDKTQGEVEREVKL